MTPSIVLFSLSSIVPEADLGEVQGCSRIFLFVRLFPNIFRVVDAKLVLMLKQLDGMVVHSSESLSAVPLFIPWIYQSVKVSRF